MLAHALLYFLIGYLGASVVVPTLDVYYAEAVASPPVKVISKYVAYNRLHPKEVRHGMAYRKVSHRRAR